MYGGSVGSSGGSEVSVGGTIPLSFSSARSGLNAVEINVIRDEEGVYLRNALIDRFYSSGYPSNPLYTLEVDTINETTVDLDVTVDSEATRQQMTLNTTARLIDKASGKIVLTRFVKAASSYDIIGSQFTTRVAANDVRESILDDLARQIEMQIVLYFKR